MSTAWSVEGEYMEACSCDFLCPCIIKNMALPATHDFCKVALTFEITKGQFGDVPLDGVRFAMIAESQAMMAAGGWKAGLVIDAAASDAQAAAVGAIASEAGHGPLAAFAPLISEFRGVERAPIAFERNGNTRSVDIGGKLEQTVEGIPSMTTPGQCVAIDEAAHPVTKRLNLATALRNVISAFGITWRENSGRTNGHFAPFAWVGVAE